ncbi:endonuclease/exonuclease/phosphatase family protein [Streptomyces phaeolivaceus]|uniref:Endonuclease/exonuclease/phosphatase family protein n=1 Tax=Streptomyces phaeolivaceus TaxID=2653200 RepID=A0A5P8K200_9ACTN|nr:endonuclease/exonuclease/phosphatase family protein [Streptomyces phaeolivaceus]QFQ97074.1 endonuclease/exonuclease/phosphatase family protein [Streptomyces phaeolivaceus]
MTIRIATFNAENLFRRPTVFGLDDDARRKEVLDDFTELVALLGKEIYQEADRARIAELIVKHDAHDSNPGSRRPFLVNQPRGGAKLYTVSTTGGPAIKIVAKGRPKWSGWAELVRGDISWDAVENTARVIAEVDADILLTVEVEDRLTLDRFNTQVLGGTLGHDPYPFNLLVDGNDSRGIDVGILSRFPVTSVRSHIFDLGDNGTPVFSRDCPEFEVEVGDEPLWILGNHFKSKGFGKASENDKRRRAQARRVREIYEAALARSSRVVVAGDLNDSLASPPIKLLLDAGLREAMTHDSYGTQPPGTHGTGKRDEQKLDYLMFSPELWDRVTHVGVERRGIWAPRTFESFTTVTSKLDQASDHAALFADLDL